MWRAGLKTCVIIGARKPLLNKDFWLGPSLNKRSSMNDYHEIIPTPESIDLVPRPPEWMLRFPLTTVITVCGLITLFCCAMPGQLPSGIESIYQGFVAPVLSVWNFPLWLGFLVVHGARHTTDLDFSPYIAYCMLCVPNTFITPVLVERGFRRLGWSPIVCLSVFIAIVFLYMGIK